MRTVKTGQKSLKATQRTAVRKQEIYYFNKNTKAIRSVVQNLKNAKTKRCALSLFLWVLLLYLVSLKPY